MLEIYVVHARFLGYRILILIETDSLYPINAICTDSPTKFNYLFKVPYARLENATAAAVVTFQVVKIVPILE